MFRASIFAQHIWIESAAVAAVFFGEHDFNMSRILCGMCGLVYALHSCRGFAAPVVIHRNSKTTAAADGRCAIAAC